MPKIGLDCAFSNIEKIVKRDDFDPKDYYIAILYNEVPELFIEELAKGLEEVPELKGIQVYAYEINQMSVDSIEIALVSTKITVDHAYDAYNVI